MTRYVTHYILTTWYVTLQPVLGLLSTPGSCDSRGPERSAVGISELENGVLEVCTHADESAMLDVNSTEKRDARVPLYK